MSDGSTRRIVGAVVGAVAAYYTFGASTVLTGAALGSAIGGAFDKTKTEGPRLDNLKVQQSNYGVGIPTLYGTERLTPNVMWSTDKIELPFTTSQGKGGGVENTSWRSFVHMRHILCETPRDGSTVSLVKIFQDGKLIWDASSGTPVGAALASAENLFASFILYQGHQDQMPNPEEEAWLGVGNVPAYRGVVSIYMRAIECPGGRVPQFSFVGSNGATIGPTIQEVTSIGDTRNPPFDEVCGIVGSSNVFHCIPDTLSHTNPRSTMVYYGESGSITPLGRIGQVSNYDPATSPPSNVIPIAGGPPAMAQLVYMTAADKAVDLVTVVRIDAQTGSISTIGTFSPSDPGYGIYQFGWAAYDDVTGSYVLVPNPINTLTTFPMFTSSGTILVPMPSTGYGPTAAHSGLVYMMDPTGVMVTVIDPNVGELATYALPGMVASAGGAQLMHANATGVYALFIGAGGSATGGVFKFDGTGFSVLTNSVFLGGAADPQFIRSFYSEGTYAMVGPYIESTTFSYQMIRFHAVDLAPVKAKDIIADQCQRAGNLTYDVSGVPDSDTVIGYKIPGPASARTNIDPLLTCFCIFAVDEDGQTKFKKLSDITSVATVTFDELGQTEGDAVDAMPLARTQEIDLPRSVTTNYVEPLLDYQTASETEIRQVTEATEDVSIDLPMAITSDQDRAAAQTILFARWRSQNTRTCAVSRKFAFVSPGDGVTVEYPRGTLRMWRVMSANDTGALIEWSVEPADSQLFTQTATGSTGYVGQEVDALAPPTNLVLLDTPILRDEDNNAGLYAAAEGFASAGWNGYTLWSGIDDSSLQERGSVKASVPIGFAESALGGWSSNTLDGKNSVIVSMGDDTLSSVTDAVLMTTRQNLAFIGVDGRWEAIQFMTASSLGGGRYLLYGLLRGLYGTERFRGTHQANDRFVLINSEAGMLRPGMSAGSIGQSMQYRGVSLGRNVDSAPSQSFANHAVGLLPYSPWNAVKSLAASNDQTITWERRSRLSTNALRGVVPLGETTEAYRVDFYTSSAFTTLAGTLASSTKSLTITSAQQTAFGLTPGATLYLRIRQVSDTVGAGAPLEATL